MAHFPPPPPPDKNLSNSLNASSQATGADHDKTKPSRQTATTQQSGQPDQRSWTTANPQSPRLQNKPSQVSLKVASTDFSASAIDPRQQSHTSPTVTPRGGPRSQQQASSAPTADPSQAPLATLLMNSASPVYTRTVTTSTVTTSTTTATTSTAIPPSGAMTTGDTNKPKIKNSAKEHRLKKTDKKTAVYGKQPAGSSVNGADMSPKEMAKFLRRAVTEDGKFTATKNTMKTFMRSGFGKVDEQSAQTCFAQFLRPAVGSGDLKKLYQQMAFGLLDVKRDAHGEETSTIKMLDRIIVQENVNPTNVTSNVAVRELLEPAIKPLFDYLNDVGDSVANSELPGKLLEFMVEFDRELVKWHRDTEKSRSKQQPEGIANSANSDEPLSEEDLMTIRRNAQIALLGVKGVDGYLGTEVFKQLEGLGFHSTTDTGGVLKNFNSYLSRIYSKNCDALINSVLSATDEDIARIRERRAEEEKEERAKKAGEKFSRLKQKSETKNDQSSNKKTDLRNGADTTTENAHSLRSPRSGTGSSEIGSVFSGRRLHELEELNEVLVNVFLAKYPGLNDFRGIVSTLVKAIDTKYTKLGKSPSDKELRTAVVDAMQKELNAVADKISIVQDPTELAAQQAVYSKLSTVMGEVLLRSAQNPFDE